MLLQVITTTVEEARLAETGGAEGIELMDTEAFKRLLDAAGELDVTFHRTFDEAADQEHGDA